MGKRGPPKKPSALKRLDGTYRPCRAAPNEMEPEAGAPNCPDHLDDAARAEWLRVVPELERLGVITLVDGAALEAYCSNYALATWFQRVASRVPMVKTPQGPMPNPAASAARKHWIVAKQFLTEFGLTPASRTRISANPKAQRDEAAEFLGLTAIPGGRR